MSAKNEMTFNAALFIIIGIAILMGVCIMGLGLDAHIPLMFGIVLVTLVGMTKGFTWKDIYEGVKRGIQDAIEPTIILALVGLVIGTWILSGTVPTIIYYGLKLMSPQLFLVVTAIVCGIVSTMTGTAWGTAGTVGIAFMGIGSGLGFSPAITAGAVLSGAYFGDKMSPMSDTTILASAIAGADIWDHIRSMCYTTVPGVLLALGFFAYTGYHHETTGSIEAIQTITEGISAEFNINILLVLPALFVIIQAIRKKSAIPTLFCSTIIAGLLAMMFQNGVTIKSILVAMHNGYVSNTGIAMLDKLLSKGGLNSMMWSVSLILIALSFGGALQEVKVMETLISRIVVFIKSDGKLIAINLLSCFLGDAMMGTQYMGIIIPGKMFQKVYEERNIESYVQSRILEDSGTLLDCLIPWSIGATFFSSTLGVSVYEYAPYVIMNWSVPIISMLYGFLGIATFKKNN